MNGRTDQRRGLQSSESQVVGLNPNLVSCNDDNSYRWLSTNWAGIILSILHMVPWEPHGLQHQNCKVHTSSC